MSSNLITSRPSAKQIAIASCAIFLVAFGVRLLSWHDTRREVWKVQTVVAEDYQRAGKLLRQEGVRGFFSSGGPLADPNLLGHPLGYPIIQALLSMVFGESTTAVQFFQITCDALAAVLIFLIAIELLPWAVGVVAGFLVALAPQLTWNSVLLLPDTLSVLPLLAAVYCLVRAVKRPRLVMLFAAGACVGLSCWLRANALLMAPFLAFAVLVLFDRKPRWRYAGALLAGAIVVIAPLTLRNWIVFQHFIPVSLGAGQTMLEGIADYDTAGRFGVPNTDMGIMRQEAQQHNRPDYYSTLFAPDGVQRDRLRVARAFGIIRDNPLWFASVMARRAGSMFRLERARLISALPPTKYFPEDLNGNQRVWVFTPFDPNESLVLPEGVGLQTPRFTTERNRDYVIKFPAAVYEGRMTVDVVGQGGKVYASQVIEKVEVKEGYGQPVINVELPFMSDSDGTVFVSFNNASPPTGRSVAHVGTMEAFDLGPASWLWTRYPRLLIRGIQRLFITAIMLPLMLIGIAVVAWRRQWRTLVLLLAVPAYFLIFQSLLHTEYRYVLAIHYFLFVFVAVALYEIVKTTMRLVRRRARPERAASQ